uniref:Ig-like domain-containing protein n=1 Tax=Neogobius melanostomus TaxID=47308 RepID=A0A8C6WW41_9GOBI
QSSCSESRIQEDYLELLTLLLPSARPCQHWAVDMPRQVVGLGSSCVLLPCSFTLPPEFEPQLDRSCQAVWKRGSWSRTQVFHSGAAANLLQGNLTGNLQERDCTTVFYNLPPHHYDDYYFRLECETLKFNFYDMLWMNVPFPPLVTPDALPKPTVSPFRLEVEEGSQVTLNCSAAAPCPSEAPVLDWSPGTLMSSVMSFSASHLHNGATVSCSALYRRAAVDTELLYETSLTLRVLFPPKNTSVQVDPPGVVLEGSSVSLLCESRSNPAVTHYSWFRDGQERTEVRGAILVWEVANHNHSGAYHCEAWNQLGQDKSDTFQLDVQCEYMTLDVEKDNFRLKSLDSLSILYICMLLVNRSLQRRYCQIKHVFVTVQLYFLPHVRIPSIFCMCWRFDHISVGIFSFIRDTASVSYESIICEAFRM